MFSLVDFRSYYWWKKVVCVYDFLFLKCNCEITNKPILSDLNLRLLSNYMHPP